MSIGVMAWSTSQPLRVPGTSRLASSWSSLSKKNQQSKSFLVMWINYELAAVEYKASEGKYSSQNIFPWDEIPDDDIKEIDAANEKKRIYHMARNEDKLEDGGNFETHKLEEGEHFERLIDPSDGVQIEEPKPTKCLKPGKEGQSWWPVIMMHVTDKARSRLKMRSKVITICWYQWQETPIWG